MPVVKAAGCDIPAGKRANTTEQQMKNRPVKVVRKGKKKTAKVSELALTQAMDINAELQAVRVMAAKTRSIIGAYKGLPYASSFTVDNPEGGIPLLEDAACTLVRGQRYGLIGCNKTCKSTMLCAFATRCVGDLSFDFTVRYVSYKKMASLAVAGWLAGCAAGPQVTGWMGVVSRLEGRLEGRNVGRRVGRQRGRKEGMNFSRL